MNFSNKKVTVMGLGLHGGGLAVTKFLAKKGAIITVTDLKSAKQLVDSIKQLQSYKINYILGKHRLVDFQKADMIIKNPGVRQNSPFIAAAIKKHIPIETDLSLFFKLCPSKKIIGITGTKGKSTTTKLLFEIIKRKHPQAIIGGNIRISPLQFLSKIKPDTPVVLELSSWQLEDLAKHKISPQYAVVTNVLRDHLNTYKNMANYAEAKTYIFKFQQPADSIVLNKDNELTRKMASQIKSRLVWFSLSKLAAFEVGCFISNGWVIYKSNKQQQKIIAVKEIKLLGEHNLQNILAAVTLSKILDIPNQIIKSGVRDFKGLESRLQLIATKGGVKYFNDTTATTPDAVIAALNCFNQKVVLLAGGTDKKLDFKKLAAEIKKKVKALILFEGTATDKLVKELKKINYNQTLVFVDSMTEAFKQAKYILQSKDIFLLSPGAASFGLFVNEFDRGRQFNQNVLKLKK